MTRDAEPGLRSALATRAEHLSSRQPDLTAIAGRARTLRRRRAFGTAGMAATAVAAVVLGATLLAPWWRGDVHTPATAHRGGAPSVVRPSADPDAPILAQLQVSPAVIREMVGYPELRGAVFLCAMRRLGASGSGDRLYVWLFCGAYRTGAHARLVSAGSEPAVVVLGDAGPAGRRLRGVTFGPEDETLTDLRRMFPDPIARLLLDGRPPGVRPTQAQLLARARAVGTTPASPVAAATTG